jgi:hypothetical protein
LLQEKYFARKTAKTVVLNCIASKALARHKHFTSLASFQALYFQCDIPKLEQRIASSAAIDFDFHFVVALQVQEYFDRSATMGSSEYDDEIYDDDESEDDEDDKNYDPPRELTPNDIAGIASLNSEGQLQDLIEDIDANLAVVKLRDWADLKAERLEYLKKAHRAPRCQHVKLNDKALPAVKSFNDEMPRSSRGLERDQGEFRDGGNAKIVRLHASRSFS